MSEMTLIVPNDWVTEEKLVEITGLRPGTIERARKKCWMVGREYRHVSPDGVPKKKQRMHVQPKGCRPVGGEHVKETAGCAPMKIRLCLAGSWTSGGNNG